MKALRSTENVLKCQSEVNLNESLRACQVETFRLNTKRFQQNYEPLIRVSLWRLRFFSDFWFRSNFSATSLCEHKCEMFINLLILTEHHRINIVWYISRLDVHNLFLSLLFPAEDQLSVAGCRLHHLWSSHCLFVPTLNEWRLIEMSLLSLYSWNARQSLEKEDRRSKDCLSFKVRLRCRPKGFDLNINFFRCFGKRWWFSAFVLNEVSLFLWYILSSAAIAFRNSLAQVFVFEAVESEERNELSKRTLDSLSQLISMC